MITKIKLSNWRSHFDTELSFSRGVNALVGIMGSGKSSITEAISFGLFGTSPILQGKKTTIEEMITTKPKPQSRGVVELEFLVDGKSYNVRRTIERGKTTEAEMRGDGQLIQVGPAAVTEEVERLFGLDYELFSKAIYSEQNGLDHFLRMSKGSRVEHIDRMLKLDRFERAREAAVALTNKVRQKREQMIRLVADMESEKLEPKIEIFEREIKQMSEEKVRLSSEKTAASKSSAELSERLSVFEEKEKVFHIIEKDIERQKASLCEAQAMANSKNDFDMHSLEEKIKIVTESISGMEAEAKGLEEHIEEGRNRLAEINSKVAHITESLASLKGLGATCPVCESEINNEKKSSLLGKRSKEEVSLRTEAEKTAADIKQNKARQLELSKNLMAKKTEKIRLEHDMKKAEELKALEARIKEYSEKLANLEKERSILEQGLAKTDAKNLRNQLHVLIGRERELAARLCGISERISDKQISLKDIQKRLAVLNEYKAELANDEQTINKLSEFVKALKLTQSQLRDEFVKTVNWIMEQVWPELYPYADFESVRLSYDEDYVLQLKEAGKEWRHVDGIASGGERSMACLALRIAFAHAFSPSFKWLILDEPTHNLDAQAIQQLTEILKERIDQFAEQVFLITHEERLSDGLAGNIYKLERDKARAGPTKVLNICG